MKNIKLKPPPGGPVCDICNGRPVVARYKARTFVMLEKAMRSVGDWAACETCEKLIDAKDIDGMVRRAEECFATNTPWYQLVPQDIKDQLNKELRQNYVQFFDVSYGKTRWPE